MTLGEMKSKMETIKEGQYTAKILRLERTDSSLFANEPVILKVLITELNRVQTIFLNTKKEHTEDASIYERTCFDIYNQLADELDGDNVSMDNIEQISALFTGHDVDVYVLHNLASDGKEYTNFYFNKANKKVRAYLEMQ